MSGSVSKVIFEDGTELFTVGDESELRMRRLYPTPEAAWDAYCDGEIAVTPEDYRLAETDAVAAIVLTQYGSGAWTEMLTTEGLFSQEHKIMVRQPRYSEY